MTNKKALLDKCLEILTEKISVTQKAIDAAQQSANAETKSSAGDKYETGRAMSQNERDLNSRHLAELLNMRKTLLAIEPSKDMDKVRLGAVVQTNSVDYFISVALGKIEIDGLPIFAISALSPIAQAMLGKQVQDRFEWQKKTSEIFSIY